MVCGLNGKKEWREGVREERGDKDLKKEQAGLLSFLPAQSPGKWKHKMGGTGVSKSPDGW